MVYQAKSDKVEGGNMAVDVTQKLPVKDREDKLKEAAAATSEKKPVDPIWENGKKLVGEVRSKEEARRIYDEIVRRQRDPGLLEYAGKDLFQASIFPIPPNSDATDRYGIARSRDISFRSVR